MDLTQDKLTRLEWNGIEIPVDEKEKPVLSLIQDGFTDIQIRRNNNKSMISLIKISYTPEIETFLYKKYFEKVCAAMVAKFAPIELPLLQASKVSASESKKPPNSKDLIRLSNTEQNIEIQKLYMVEFTIVDLCRKALLSLYTHTTDYSLAIYTLNHINKATISNINKHVIHFAKTLIQWTIHTKPALIGDMLHTSQILIEKNPLILKYADITLFEHQKRIYQIFGPASDRKIPKLILYIAPTGTGKTLTPLGLSATHRVIFVCMARHVGLALARSAITMDKCVAFAFGADTASDIRLHYFSAIDYTKDRKSGGIRKVDNSIGHKVEIMICDVKSYRVAMHYMLAFNRESDIITFWDEPTITMDYDEHSLHQHIRDNWRENLISKVVLSCATLPVEGEIQDTIDDFRSRFQGAEIHTITSYDNKKSITILNKSGYSTLPHLLFADYADLAICIIHCEQTRSLLRYFALAEIVRFVEYISAAGYIKEQYTIAAYFTNIRDITMDNIKLYYLEVLKHLNKDRWPEIYQYMSESHMPMFGQNQTRDNDSTNLRKIKSMEQPSNSVLRIGGGELTRTSSMRQGPVSTAEPVKGLISIAKSPHEGVLITTKDAHTLTDGPTIFLAENIETVGKFCIAQAKIPTSVLNLVMEKIDRNNGLQFKIDLLESEIVQKETKKEEATDEKFKGTLKRDTTEKQTMTKEVRELLSQISDLREQIMVANIDSAYIPNTTAHQKIWTTNTSNSATSNSATSNSATSNSAFIPYIDEASIREIMSLDVENQQKLLLMLGIGMFMNNDSGQMNNDSGQMNNDSGQMNNDSGQMNNDSGLGQMNSMNEVQKQKHNKRNNHQVQYTEIMKKLANEKKLFLIIAGSDYVYGTNYQFSHGFIGKDLTKMTQQKTIQAMGRIGRGNIQQEYTVRFRDDDVLRQLFLPARQNTEAEVMSKLMCGSAEWADENEDLISATLNQHDSKEDDDETVVLHRRYTKYTL